MSDYPSQDRAQHPTHRNHHARQTPDKLLLLHRGDFREDNHGQAIQTRPSNALHDSTCDQLIERLRKAAADGKREEDDEGSGVGISSPENVAKAGEDYDATDVRKGIGEGDPGNSVQGVEIGSDRIEGGRNDRGIKKGEEKADGETGHERY